VSSLAEADFFADGGFDDILYAVPITPDKLEQAAALTARLDSFLVIVDHEAQVEALLKHPQPKEGKPWRVVLMVDCGYHRDGVDPDDEASIALARRIANAPTARFIGIYTHGGHSYDAESVEAIIKIGEQERDVMVDFSSKLKGVGIECDMVGVGSTPTSSNPPSHLNGVTEMHPGNYIYYDWMQAKVGSCKPADVAVRVCTRIIGHYPKQNMLLIDMGWTGISAQGKEHGFGFIDGHPELKIVQLKQECGAVESTDGTPLDFAEYPIGSILRVLPWHSCAASHQHECVHVLEDGKIVGCWKKVRGW
jgi:D-serine deaminase-like pyridoxal phosphate-dependent protein